MAENLEISEGSKNDKYELLYKQIKGLGEVEQDSIAFMANACAMIHSTFQFLWTGFYRVKDGMLVLGPFQGSLACTRIAYGKGVCGTAWREGRTLIVDDVEAFPGHIACSGDSRSEIVVPVIFEGEVKGVLDIDSDELSTFDQVDAMWLERIVAVMPKW